VVGGERIGEGRRERMMVFGVGWIGKWGKGTFV
jgi:hypothetical protein